MAKSLRDIIEETPLIDTHEHLIEESIRTEGTPNHGLFPCNDWAYLFFHYFSDDLAGAGMTADTRSRFFSPEETTETKYALVAPFWERSKHTGYGRAVRETLRGLYGEDDLTAESAPRIAEKYRAFVNPGFYRTVLQEKSNVPHCQVNSLMHTFCDTAQPDILKQDIGLPNLTYPAIGPDRSAITKLTGQTINSLEDYIAFLERFFAEKAPKAVAVKSQCAYWRRLNFDNVQEEIAVPLFARLLQGESLQPEEHKAVEDFLFRWCAQKATEYGLPIKLHTGYYAGHNRLPLARLRDNASDLTTLLDDFPDAKFVLMHIGYPYQHDFLALAKSYVNVNIDLCWAWIINPAATAQFVYEFLLSVPSNKLLTFGGDYIVVEDVYGHSRIARQGLHLALNRLIAEGWMTREEVDILIPLLMNGNATALFPPR
jgi:hypothetical protein